MFRCSRFVRMPWADARRLFLAADGTALPTPSAPLPQVLGALKANYCLSSSSSSAAAASSSSAAGPADAAEREALVAAAMGHLVQLDSDNGDSELIAGWTRPVEETAAPTVDADADADGKAKSVHVVVDIMRAFPHNLPIKEACCRCIANICQLAAPPPRPSSASASASAESEANVRFYGALNNSHAEVLVQEGAVERVLGTMSAVQHLSRKGRCWTALAALNLTCLSRSGAGRAAAANAEEVLSEFILVLLESATPGGDGVLVDEDGLVGIALDAALGALAAVLAAEAPENDQRISYNYEKVSYAAVDAMVRALLAVSALMVRDGRNDGAYNASLPARRYGSAVHMLTGASERQQQATVSLLPQLHKGWMGLQSVASHHANLPLIYDAMYEAANANQEHGGRVADGDDATDINDDDGALEVTADTERRYVAALTQLLEAALFTVVELEGVAEASDELARLQAETALYFMEVMAAMTAPRRDVKPPCDSEAADVAGEGEGEEEDVSAVVPTPAALGVSGVLASGLVSSVALATVVRLHAEQQDVISRLKEARRTDQAAELAPYSTDHFTLLSKSLMVLSHLGEAEDEIATSANAVAALQAVLRDAVDLIRAFPFHYGGDVSALFRPTASEAGDDKKGSSSSNGGAADVRAHDRLSMMQHLALVGQLYTVLYSVLRTPAGVALVTELDVPRTAADMQHALVSVYGRGIETARRTYGSGAEGEGEWVATAAEESVVRLTKLGEQFLSTLGKLSPIEGANNTSSSSGEKAAKPSA